MIQAKCFKCGGDRVLISRSIDRPDYASHTEDDCLIALNYRIAALEAHVRHLLLMVGDVPETGDIHEG